MKKNLLILFLFLSSFSFSQSWQALYDSTNSCWGSDWESCRQILVSAKTQAEKEFGKMDSTYALTINDLAICYKRTGDYKTAKELHLEAINIHKKIFGKNSLDYASSINNLATLYNEQGNFPKAELLLLEAQSIYDKQQVVDPSYTGICNNLAALYHDMGNYKEAERYYFLTKKFIEKFMGKNNPFYATILNNLGYHYHRLNIFDKAEKYYLEAKNIRATVLGTNHPDYLVTCDNLGLLYNNMEKFNASKELHLLAKETIEKVYGKKNATYAIMCNNLAEIYAKTDEYKISEKLHLEANSIAAEILPKNHPYIANFDNSTAYFYSLNGKYSEAAKLFMKSLQTKREELASNFVGMSEHERNLYLSKNAPFFQYFNRFVLESNTKLTKEEKDSVLRFEANIILQMRYVLMSSTQKMKKRIFASGDTTLIKAYEKWTDLRYIYAKYSQFSKAKLKSLHINLDSLQKEINTREKYLSTKSQDFKETFLPKIPSWQELQKTLKKGEVAVQIFRAVVYGKDSINYAALLTTTETKTAPELVFLNGKGKYLESTGIKYYRQKIKKQKKDLLSYQNFWQKLDEKIKDYKKIYLSPDGVYNLINPKTLYNPDTKKYIFDQYDIKQFTTMRDFVYSNNKKSQNQKDLLIGNPTYEIKDSEFKGEQNKNIEDSERGKGYGTELDLRNVSFIPLSGTETEVKTITTLLKKKNHNAKIYLKADAKEEIVKQAQNPTVLHIATHGFFIQSDSTFPRKAMMNSGIAFAGITNYAKAQDKPNTEDGLLTAYEAQNLDLDSTELVVLSACETGLGEISSGEGVYGLQRAFKVAGAKTIIMSLWNVNDQATQELMTLFYKFWFKTNNKQIAFTKAQQKLKKKYKHPYYWGAFVIVE